MPRQAGQSYCSALADIAQPPERLRGGREARYKALGRHARSIVSRSFGRSGDRPFASVQEIVELVSPREKFQRLLFSPLKAVVSSGGPGEGIDRVRFDYGSCAMALGKRVKTLQTVQFEVRGSTYSVLRGGGGKISVRRESRLVRLILLSRLST